MLSHTGLPFARETANKLSQLGLGELVKEGKQDYFIVDKGVVQDIRDSLQIDEKVIILFAAKSLITKCLSELSPLIYLPYKGLG